MEGFRAGAGRAVLERHSMQILCRISPHWWQCRWPLIKGGEGKAERKTKTIIVHAVIVTQSHMIVTNYAEFQNGWWLRAKGCWDRADSHCYKLFCTNRGKPHPGSSSNTLFHKIPQTTNFQGCLMSSQTKYIWDDLWLWGVRRAKVYFLHRLN